MNQHDDIYTWIERYVDGEIDGLPPEVERAVAESPHYQAFFEARQALAVRLDALETPPPPDSLTDDVMHFIAQQEGWAAQPQSRAWEWPEWLDWRWWVPQVVRREAWSLAMAGVAVVWGLALAPQLQQGTAFERIQPISMQVDAVAENLREQGEEFSGWLANYAKDMIAAPSQQSEAGQELDSSRMPDGKHLGASARPNESHPA
mgnify:CR=1 FL=1